jgi:hypothetical protein
MLDDNDDGDDVCTMRMMIVAGWFENGLVYQFTEAEQTKIFISFFTTEIDLVCTWALCLRKLLY